MEQLISSPIRKTTKKTGFTLIELMVSITILMLLVGGAMASYITFNERQQLASAAKELQTYLRSAQSRARAGDTPTGCNSLESYAVRVGAFQPVVRLVAVCDNGDVEKAQYDLTGGAGPTAALNIGFGTLRGGVTNAQTITLELNDRTYTFAVTPGGEISEGDFD